MPPDQHASRSAGWPRGGDPAAPHPGNGEPDVTGSREPLGPARPLRVMAGIEVLLCSGFPTQILMAGLLTMAGVEPTGPDGRLSLTFVTALSLLDAALLIGLILYFLRVHGERPRELFLGRREVGREAALGVALIPFIFLVVLSLTVLIRTLAPWLRTVPRNPLEEMLQTPEQALIFGVVVIVAGGVREELQRAFILRRFEQYLGGAIVGLVLFSIAFGAGHAHQGLDAVVITATLGIIWGGVYLGRRSVVAPVVSHAGFNVAEIVRHMLFRVRS